MTAGRLYIFLIVLSVLNLNTSCLTQRSVTIENIKSENFFNKGEPVNEEYLILKLKKEKYKVSDYRFESDYVQGKLMPFLGYKEGRFIMIQTNTDIFDPARLDSNFVLTLPHDEIDSYMDKTISSYYTVDNIYSIGVIVADIITTLVGGTN